MFDLDTMTTVRVQSVDTADCLRSNGLEAGSYRYRSCAALPQAERWTTPWWTGLKLDCENVSMPG